MVGEYTYDPASAGKYIFEGPGSYSGVTSGDGLPITSGSQLMSPTPQNAFGITSQGLEGTRPVVELEQATHPLSHNNIIHTNAN